MGAHAACVLHMVLHFSPCILFMAALANQIQIYLRFFLFLMILSQVQQHVIHSLRFLCSGSHFPAETDELFRGREFHLECAGVFIKVYVALINLAFSLSWRHFSSFFVCLHQTEEISDLS